MARLRKVTRKSKKEPIDKLPFVALVLSGGGAILAYLVSEFALYSQAHPIHWVAAIGIGSIGYIIGMFIYLNYGDIFA